MLTTDIQSLLRYFFSQGFTLKTLCNVTKLEPSLINKYMNDEILTEDELSSIKPLLYFLTQLYCMNKYDKEYLSNIINVMNVFFDVSLDAIATYLGLSIKDLESFIDNPYTYNDGHNLIIKLMHLFTTFVREKDI